MSTRRKAGVTAGRYVGEAGACYVCSCGHRRADHVGGDGECGVRCDANSHFAVYDDPEVYNQNDPDLDKQACPCVEFECDHIDHRGGETI